jgi:hypothetical protein
MLLLLWRLTRGFRLAPWRSPYLRWRIETYSGRPADSIAFQDFWRFSFAHGAELWRYSRWAHKMNRGIALKSQCKRTAPLINSL